MKKSLTNNIGLKLLAFGFAFMLWFFVVNWDNPVTSRTYNDIPVSVEHEEVLTEQKKTYQIVDDTQFISVTVNAKRSILNKIKAEDIVAVADMKELYLQSQIPISVQITGYRERTDYDSASPNPGNLQVAIEDNISKLFPITPVTTGTVRDGFVLGEVTSDPESVTINGPKSVIERIDKVAVEVSVSGLAEDAQMESSLVLYDADNDVIDQSRLGNNLGQIGASVNVKLLHTKKVPITLDTGEMTAEAGYSIADITYSPQEIKIAGGDAVLEEIKEIAIPAGELAGEPLSKKTEKTVDITPYLPEGIKLVDENGTNVVVTISVEKNGTKSFNLPVGSITVKNLQEDYKMSYSGTEDLEVHVAGSAQELSKLEIDKSASIDLKDLKEAGKYKVPVKIKLPSTCTLEGTVTVEVVLEKK